MEFQEKLKAIYKKQNKIAPLIEGLEAEIPEQTLDDYYVKLNTIIKEDTDKKQANYEAISGQKKEVEIEDIFDQQEAKNQTQTRRLLILGGAGVGKSTLMQYIAYRWSTTGLWKEKFDFVYRVTLKILLNTGWDRDYTKEERKDELKCLIHYNLAAQAQDESLKLEEMPWLEKKDRILLLLDGYDEVAHERNGIYKKLFEKIFEHENIILTSRPNAIDKQMAERFGKKIENTGLDHNGINKYLSQYFKNDPEKGEELQEFLEKNTSIKEICRIPVNIAMLCFIWSEGGSNEALREIANMSDLYKQVVDHLGFRFYAKQQSNLQQNIDELMSKWKGGEIYLDELQALVYTAYKGMTGGGIEVPNDKRLQTLIIKGMTKKGDKDGISLQSSLNYLRDKLKKDMPAINKVYKYGLLKPEGIAADRSNKKEPSETDLQEQSFSFIHLSFQEFLTALYLVQNLFKEDQEKIANFIAQHRNDPRYLMTLKLMTGILASNDDRETEQGIKIFWDAILCNPDGVLELGVEAKVTLLMHLFAQAKKEDKIDARIPNVEIAVSFIDSVVLRDLANWSAQIKESDYMSDNIREGLIQYLVKNHTKWLSEVSEKLQEKCGFTKSANHNPTSIEAVLELTSAMINKFSQEQQEQIFKRIVQFINEHNENNWRLTKHAMEAALTIHQKAKISLDLNEENKLLKTLLVTVYNENLTQLSLKAIQELLNVSKKPELIEKIRINAKQDFGNLKPEMQFTASKTKMHLLKIIENPVETQIVLDIVKTLAPLVENKDAQMSVIDYIREAIEISGNTDSHLLKYAITLLAPLLHHSDRNTDESATRNIDKLVKLKGNNDGPHLVKDIIEGLRPRLQDPEESVRILTSSDMTDLMSISGHNDPQIILEIISGIIPTLQNFQFNQRDHLAPRILTRILYVSQKCAPNVDREIFNLLVPLLQHPQPDVRTLTVNQLTHFRSQLGKDVINHLIPMLRDSDQRTRERVCWNIGVTVNGNQESDPQFARGTIQILAPFLKDSDSQLRIITLETIAGILRFCGGTQLVHEFTVNYLTLFFQDSDLTAVKAAFQCSKQILSIEKTPIDYEEIFNSFSHLSQSPDPALRKLTIQYFTTTANSYLTSHRKNITLAQAAIHHLMRLIKDSDDDSEQIITDLVRIVEKGDNHPFKDLLEILTPFLKDPSKNIRKTAAITIAQLPDGSIQDVMSILSPFLQDPDSAFKTSVLHHIIKSMKKTDSKDSQLSTEVLKVLTPVLHDPDMQLIISASTSIVEIMQMSGSQDKQLCSEIIKVLTPFLQNPGRSVQSTISCNIVETMEISGHNDLQLCKEILQVSIPILQDSHFPVRTSASTSIAKIVKINPELGQDVIENSLSPLLQQDSIQMQIKNTVIWTLLKILPLTGKENEIPLIQQMTRLLTQMLQEPDNDPIKYHATPNILALMKITTHYEDQLWKDLMKFLGKTLVLQYKHRYRENQTASQKIIELASLPGLSGGVIKELIPFFYDSDATYDTFRGTISSIMKINGNQDTQFVRQVIHFFTPLFRDPNQRARFIALETIYEIFESTGNTDPELGGEVTTILIPLQQEPDHHFKYHTSRIIIDLLQRTGKKNSQLLRDSIKILAQLFQDADEGMLKSLSQMALSDIMKKNDPQLRQDIIELLTPFFEHSNIYTAFSAIRVLSWTFPDFLKHPERFTEYLTHASKNMRNEATNFLFDFVEEYIQNFKKLDQLFQRPASDLTFHLIINEFFDRYDNRKSVPEDFQKNLRMHLEKLHLQEDNTSDLKSFLVSQINKIKDLEGPQIIELAMVIIGQEKISKDGSRRQELIELAKEMLSLQLKYLTEEGLVWIQNNYEKLKSLSPESKIFYKRVFHKLVEDGEITSLEEDLIIKFINQGLTTSLTRDGEIIFEGKRYKLFGNDIELILEKIAKNVIDQQQDILAKQYKDHEPIFKKTFKGGMIEAAADIKEVKSLVDSRHVLKNDAWLLTKLKSLKFNSEIFLLEQLSAFGDHVIYHMKQQKLFRFYPEKPPVLEEIFGSYIYGETYQGEVSELAYEVGQKLLENKDIIKPTNVEGKLRSKQIYFQQELLKQGNEDRNSAVEEELAKKLDNNRAVLEAKLKSFKLHDTDKSKIHDYYEGFISTFSSVYTSSQAIDSGKLSIDDGEDFFSPVNIFIQLSSLAPFGIGEILSGGLEAARSYIKSNEIKNEARFVKDIAIDAVELSELVSKIALNIISNQEQRKKILEAKDDNTGKNGLIDKIQNLVNEKLEKLKNLAEKYTKMKNLFEKEIQTSPAFRLGEDDANKIIKEWIDLKGSQPDLRLKPEEKQKKFLKTILGEEKVGQGTKISPSQMTPQEEQLVNKSACCEIF